MKALERCLARSYKRQSQFQQSLTGTRRPALTASFFHILLFASDKTAQQCLTATHGYTTTARQEYKMARKVHKLNATDGRRGNGSRQSQLGGVKNRYAPRLMCRVIKSQRNSKVTAEEPQDLIGIP